MKWDLYDPESEMIRIAQHIESLVTDAQTIDSWAAVKVKVYETIQTLSNNSKCNIIPNCWSCKTFMNEDTIFLHFRIIFRNAILQNKLRDVKRVSKLCEKIVNDTELPDLPRTSVSYKIINKTFQNTDWIYIANKCLQDLWVCNILFEMFWGDW